MELKVEKDRVVEAAKICPDAKKVLQTLFPEAFSSEEPGGKVRSFYKNTDSGLIYMMTSLGYMGFSLISVSSGECFCIPQLTKIQAFGGKRDRFLQINGRPTIEEEK